MTIGTLDNRALAQPTTSFTITVSRPSPALRPNGGTKHYMWVAGARRGAKEEARLVTLEALNGKTFRLPDGAFLAIEYTEVLGHREHVMDDDNLIAAMKAYRDGMALALAVNDKRFVTFPAKHRRGEALIRGQVEIRVWPVGEVTP